MILLSFSIVCSFFVLPILRRRESFSKDKTLLLKAVLSLMIVCHHLAQRTDIPELYQFRELGGVVVCVFIFISGYGLYSSWEKYGTNYLDNFHKRRTCKVLEPFLMASFLFELLRVCGIFEAYNFENIVRNTVRYAYTPLPFSWYIYYVVLWYELFFLIFCIARQKVLLIIMASLVYMLISIKFMGDGWIWPSFGFAAGILYKKHESFFDNMTWKSSNLFYICVSVFVLVLVNIKDYPFSNYCVIIAYPMVAILLFELLKRFRFKLCVFVAFIGGISYEIYLVQGFPMMFFHGYFNIGNDYIYIFLSSGMTILMAFFLDKFVHFFNKVTHSV